MRTLRGARLDPHAGPVGVDVLVPEIGDRIETPNCSSFDVIILKWPGPEPKAGSNFDCRPMAVVMARAGGVVDCFVPTEDDGRDNTWWYEDEIVVLEPSEEGWRLRYLTAEG